MIYHAVIGKLNNNDAILGFEGFHSRKKLVRMYKEYIMEEFSTDDKKIEVSYILSSNTPIKCKEMVKTYDS
jgi:hypothetical protein